jgi:hypothetical protein
MRRLSILFAIAAVGLLGSGLYLALKPAPDRSELVVEDQDRNFGEVPVGESILAFRIANPSDRAGRIIGLAEG